MNRIPDQSLVAEGPPNGLDHVTATRASDGGYALLYFPTGKAAKIALNKLKRGKAKASWFDPRTGGFTAVGEFETTGAVEFVPPSSGVDNDWILVLEAV